MTESHCRFAAARFGPTGGKNRPNADSGNVRLRMRWFRFSIEASRREAAKACDSKAALLSRVGKGGAVRRGWAMHIAFLSTRWGPQKGGINAFNAALCVALHASLNRQVLCIVEEATVAEREDAAAHGVLLAELNQTLDGSEACSQAIEKLVDSLGQPVSFWTGHDVWTGPTAVTMAKRSRGRSAIIHHMDFESYAQLKHSDLEAEERGKRQGSLLRNADVVFGLGPNLTESALKHGVENAFQLSPGLPNIVGTTKSIGAFQILVIGRISREDDPIKQVQLAVAGIAKASNAKGLERAEWRVKVIGFDPSGSEADYANSLRIIAAGGRAYLQLRLLPFEQTQTELFETVARADLVLMPSMREGFGLVGWEAIAAGVPVVIGTSSGLYRHLSDLGFAGMVYGIDVRGRKAAAGDYDPEDAEALAELIERAYRERKESKQQAISLQGALRGLAQAKWRTTADHFLNVIGFPRAKQTGAVPRATAHALDLAPISALLGFNNWDGESLHQLLETWDVDDLDACEKVGRLLQAAVRPAATIQQLGALHYTLRRLGHAPQRVEFFASAGRPVLPLKSLGVAFVDVPAGEFNPGSPLDEPGRCQDEGPGPLLKVSQFRMARTTITNKQFASLQPDRKFYRWREMSDKVAFDHPIVSVNWWEAYLFSIWAGGRLPTEVEWEYACRAGTTTAYYSGAVLGSPTINALVSHKDRSTAHNCTLAADSETVAHPFDLRHMHGNVWEWCWDDYNPNAYASPTPMRADLNPRSMYKVARGGSWDVPASACRSAFRNRHRPNYSNNDIGLRLVIPW